MEYQQDTLKFYTSPIWVIPFCLGIIISASTLYNADLQKYPQIMMVLIMPLFFLIGGHGSYTVSKDYISTSRVLGLYKSGFSLEKLRYIEISKIGWGRNARWNLRSFYHYPGTHNLALYCSDDDVRFIIQKLREWNIPIHNPDNHFI